MSNIIDNFAADMTFNLLEKLKCYLKVAVILITFHLLLVTASYGQTLREAFASMPDSLMPTLTRNNRLDLMDFMDAKMKAAVTNKLGGETLMTFLSSDSLSLKPSDAMTVELKMQMADTTAVVCMKRVYTTLSGESQTVLTRYAASTWQELAPAALMESTLRRIDEKATTPNL